jgi:cytochrome c2
VALGKKIVEHDCAGCHRPSGRQYTGGLFEDIKANEAFGNIYVPNITQDKNSGIGEYTEAELYRLLRTGVKKNGKVMLPIMPRFVLLAEKDIHAIIAYLKSADIGVQATATNYPDYQPSLLAKGLLSFVFKPYPYKEAYPEKPAITDAIAHGEYLVNAQLGCYFCHSQSLDTWNLEQPTLTPGYLGGGTAFVNEGYTVVSSSLLMDGQSDVSKWSEDEFIAAVKFGQRTGKPAYQKPMHPYSLLDSVEVRNIFAYLKDYSKNRSSKE